LPIPLPCGGFDIPSVQPAQGLLPPRPPAGGVNALCHAAESFNPYRTAALLIFSYKEKGGCSMTAPNRNRNHILYIRLNDKEYASFEAQREKTGLNKTDFLIRLIQSREIKVFNIQPELQEIVHELKKQGVNLNQIARSLNQNPYSPTNTSLTDLQTKYRQISDQLLTFFSTVNAL